MQGSAGRGQRIATTTAAVLVSVGALTACSDGDGDGDAEGADPTASAGEATTTAPATTEPAQPETTAEPTPTETETSEWTAEEQALIDEAEAFVRETLEIYDREFAAGFPDQASVDAIMTRYETEPGNAIWAEIRGVHELNLTRTGEFRVVGVEPIDVSARDDESAVTLDVCLDSTGLTYFEDGLEMEAEGAVIPRMYEVVLSGSDWIIRSSEIEEGREC